jgi:dUTP pyrophosphatase
MKHGITLMNCVGIIDSDYRGEVGALLWNTSDVAYEVKKGDRIAQLIIAPVVRAHFEVVDELTDTSRGSGGFGSTGR